LNNFLDSAIPNDLFWLADSAFDHAITIIETAASDSLSRAAVLPCSAAALILLKPGQHEGQRALDRLLFLSANPSTDDSLLYITDVWQSLSAEQAIECVIESLIACVLAVLGEEENKGCQHTKARVETQHLRQSQTHDPLNADEFADKLWGEIAERLPAIREPSLQTCFHFMGETRSTFSVLISVSVNTIWNPRTRMPPKRFVLFIFLSCHPLSFS
jgi:hypothetical protein